MSEGIEEKIKIRVNQLEEEGYSDFPEFSSYDHLSKKFENLQRELIKWNKELVTYTNLYSSAQAELSFIQEAIAKRKSKGGRRKSDEIKLLKKYKKRYDDLVTALKTKKYDLKTIIESVRSLQSHMFPELKV